MRLFVHTRGSLAMAMLFHFAFDYSPQFLLFRLSLEQAVWAQAIISLTAAFVFIALASRSMQKAANPVSV
jgi:hypothetical protein